MDQLTDLLWTSTPLWLSGCTALLLVINAWQQWRMSRKLDRQARIITSMDQWADAVDECLDRLDWAKHRKTPIAANTQHPWWQRRAG